MNIVAHREACQQGSLDLIKICCEFHGHIVSFMDFSLIVSVILWLITATISSIHHLLILQGRSLWHGLHLFPTGVSPTVCLRGFTQNAVATIAV